MQQNEYMPKIPEKDVDIAKCGIYPRVFTNRQSRIARCVTSTRMLCLIAIMVTVITPENGMGFLTRCRNNARYNDQVITLSSRCGHQLYLRRHTEPIKVRRHASADDYTSYDNVDSSRSGSQIDCDDDENVGLNESDDDSELEIQKFIEECGGWESDDDESSADDDKQMVFKEEEEDCDTEDSEQRDSGERTTHSKISSMANVKDSDKVTKERQGSMFVGNPIQDVDGNIGDEEGKLTYNLPEEEEDEPCETHIPFQISTPESTTNLLSKRLYVRKLFRRIPQISDTTSILVRAKAHVKGKVGCRSELAMGNSNKIKTTDTFEEPVYDGKPLYAGVYNGLSPLKHTKKRVFREIKVKIDWYAHSITHQIKNVVTFYRQLLRYIHPFQYQMLMTAIYEQYHTHKIKLPFKELLDELNTFKNTLIARAKNFNSKLFCIKKCREAFSMAKAFIFEIDELYKNAEPYINIYRKFATCFRKLPVINNNKPIIAIVGYVNVGKSWLFQKLCEEPMPIVKSVQIEEEAHTPFGLISDVLGLKWQENTAPAVKKSHSEVRIADYNFTTRSLNLANMQYRHNNVIEEGQLVDTPGLLWRDKPKTNPYEKLTYATLKDLPAGVVFCFDVSDQRTLEDQIKLYRMLENRFPHRPWINVISKGTDAQCLSEEGIQVVPHENLLENVYSMYATLDGILNMQHATTQEE